MTNIETKIKSWLQDEIKDAKEIIEEYSSEHRPKCDDGSDDFIEGNLNLCLRLLLQIEEWETNVTVDKVAHKHERRDLDRL